MAMWIVIGVASGLTLSVIVGLAIAAALGDIGRSFSRLLDFDAVQ
jgi:hypothetical protein